jgi:hypothetical protein
MINTCFHINNFQTDEINLYTFIAIYWNKYILKNKTILFVDNPQGELQEIYNKWVDKIIIKNDINFQSNEHKCRLICKIEEIPSGQKSSLFSLSEVPLVIFNPTDFSLYKDKVNKNLFTDVKPLELLDKISFEFQNFQNKLQQACSQVKTFGYCYDNKFLLVLKGNEKDESDQSNDIYINLMPNILEEKIENIKKNLIEEEKKQVIENSKTNHPDIQNTTRLNNSDMLEKINDKSQKPKYKYKLVCNWDSSENLYNNWQRMQSSGVVDLEYTKGDDHDFLVVINKPNCEYNPSNTIVYRMEPYIQSNNFYNDWIHHPKSEFMYFLEHDEFRNNTEWWLSGPINNVTITICKYFDNISTVVSSQYDMVGHKFRIDFIKYFQEHSKIAIDVFGYENKFDLQNYKGPLPQRKKNQGIFPYMYTLAVENCDITNYFTEKLYDAIIGECLCFYWGCNNVEEFINPQAFIRLDKDDFPKSLKIIEDAINNNEWYNRIDIIREEKQKIIDHFNIFTRTSSLIYMNRHMEFYINLEVNDPISFIKTNNFTSTEIDLHEDNKNLALKYLRKFDNPSIKLSHYSNILEHLDLWEKCSKGDKPFCIIMGKIQPNFVDHMCTTLSKYSNIMHKIDLIFLHENPSNGYIITPEGARNLTTVVSLYGIFSSLDNILKFSNTEFCIVAGKSDKNLVQDYTYKGRLFIHLFYTKDGMLDNSPHLFKDRDFNVLNNLFPNKHREENLTLLLDF